MPKDTSAQERADAIASAVQGASSWADLARALDKPGKRVRDVVRGTFGEYKTREGAFDVRVRAYVAAYFAEGVTTEQRATLKRNYHAGNTVEDMLLAAPTS